MVTRVTVSTETAVAIAQAASNANLEIIFIGSVTYLTVSSVTMYATYTTDTNTSNTIRPPKTTLSMSMSTNTRGGRSSKSIS